MRYLTAKDLSIFDTINNNSPIKLTQTNSSHPHFRQLVIALDADLKIRDGLEHDFYAQYNKIDAIKNVVLAFRDNIAVGCGAFKPFDTHSVEIKRMYVPPTERVIGIATLILQELEAWAAQEGYKRCVLETGKKQPEAIRLYQKSGYAVIPNYGQYAGIENSICFEKFL